MATRIEPPPPRHAPDDGDESSVNDEEQQERNEAMAVVTTLAPGDDLDRARNANTAAERAIMGVVDANQDGAIRDFVFLDENGQLVQQRFVQFLNTL
jgi:hypothetical protein